MRIMVLILTVVFCIALCRCERDIVEAQGTVTDLGFGYGIVADGGEHYEPINLPSEFGENGLRVWFKAKIRKELDSILMWGTPIELMRIEKL